MSDPVKMPGIEGALATVIELPAPVSDFAVAAGLSPEAGKTEILSAVQANTAGMAKLLDAHNAKTAEEAIGRLEAERAGTATLLEALGAKDVTEAVAGVVASRKAQQDDRAKALIKDAIDAGKCPANGEKALALYAKHGMSALEAHLDALVPHPALSQPAPVQVAPPESASASRAAPVALSDDDEKLIAKMGLDRAAFIASRQAELDAKATYEGTRG